MCKSDPNILNCAVAGDEMWVHYITPLTKTTIMPSFRRAWHASVILAFMELPLSK